MRKKDKTPEVEMMSGERYSVRRGMAEYNGLTDPNLSYFFSSPSRRKLLIKQKLVS